MAPSGAGAFISYPESWRRDNEHIRVPLGQGTNNIGELSAIGAAFKRLGDVMDANPNLTYGSIHVFSDSTYSLGCLTKGWQSNANARLITAVKIRIRSTPQYCAKNCKWHWTPGHAGVEGNTVADGLANEGSAASKHGRGPSEEALSAAIASGSFLQFANIMSR